MTIEEVCEAYYSIILYKKEGYDCFKYKFKLPQAYKKNLIRFYEKNKFQIQELAVYERSALILRILIAVFIQNKVATVAHISEKEYTLFKESLVEYKNEVSLFLNNHKVQTAKDVYLLFTKKKIPFYVFFYVLKYVRFPDGIASQELIKNKFTEIYLLMRFFKHFDEEYLSNVFKDLQNEIELQRSTDGK